MKEAIQVGELSLKTSLIVPLEKINYYEGANLILKAVSVLKKSTDTASKFTSFI